MSDPAAPLVGLIDALRSSARDLADQTLAAHDEAEVLGKLDGITARVAEAREQYLATVRG